MHILLYYTFTASTEEITQKPVGEFSWDFEDDNDKW